MGGLSIFTYGVGFRDRNQIDREVEVDSMLEGSPRWICRTQFFSEGRFKVLEHAIGCGEGKHGKMCGDSSKGLDPLRNGGAYKVHINLYYQVNPRNFL